MVVKINIYQGYEVTAEYIEINKEDKDKIKKAAKKYTKALAMFHLTVGFSKKSKNVDIFSNIILMRGDWYETYH